MEPDGADFALIFSLASIIMLLLAGVIILFVVFYQKKMIKEQFKRQELEFDYQQKMMKAELESQESERRRLAADLHDSIGGMLSTIRVGLITIGRTLPDPAMIHETKQMLDDTITSVRRISRDLMPSTLEKFGLVNALQELCERFKNTSKIEIRFREEGYQATLDIQRELMIFRIVQELLNNAIKHSGASEIEVSLEMKEDLYATVHDNGVGFDIDEKRNSQKGIKGLGLYNMENRARLLGGELEFVRGLARGTKTILKLPAAHEKAT